MKLLRLSLALFFLSVPSCTMARASDPTTAHTAPDLLLFTNGDQLTGKLMHSTGSTVTFHSDMAGDINVSWSKVKELRSERQFVVLGKDKHWSWRSLHDVPTGSITVEGEKIQLKTEKTTQIIPIKNTADVLDLNTFNREAVNDVRLYRHWTGALNLGTTLVEATQHTTSVNGGASLVRAIPSVNYLPPRNRSTINFNGSYGRITQPQAPGAPMQPDVETAIYHADAERDQYLSARVYLLAQTAFDHNFSQGLDLQQIYGAGVGWTVLKQTSQTLDLRATLQYEKQAFLATTPQENTNLVGSTFSISYMRKLPLKAVFTQQAQYLPAYNHPHAYSAYESNNLTFPLYKRLGFVLGTVDSYLNNPPPEVFPRSGSAAKFLPIHDGRELHLNSVISQKSHRSHLIHRIFSIVSLACCSLTAFGQTKPAKLEPVEHSFLLKNFHTESGVTLPEAKVVYGTYGHLNEAGDNAVLLPSHYMADMRGYEWLIGPGKALDPDRQFLITSEEFGNGRSSSPSNTPEPFHGPRFPVTTIRDNVQAVHELLTRQLGVKHLQAVIGFSMGAQQAFQWAVSYPTYMDRIVATSGTAKTYGHGVVRLESEIAALTADEAFLAGNYKQEPVKGIEAFSLVWTAWLFSQEWWRQELWKSEEPAGTTFAQVVEHYRTNFIPGADANNLILQMRTWEQHDVGATPGFGGDLAKALGSIQAQVLYMPSATDLYFPVTDARYEAPLIPHCTLVPIPSLWGHPAGAGASPADAQFLNQRIAGFLKGEVLTNP